MFFTPLSLDLPSAETARIKYNIKSAENEVIMDLLANRLKNIRRERSYTQTELGKFLSVGKSTISNYETGYSTPDIDTLIKLANLYDISLDYLLGRIQYLKEDSAETYKVSKKIPLFSKILSSDLEDYDNVIEDYINAPYFNKNMNVSVKDIFALRVDDTSLNGMRIAQNDILYIMKNIILENGDLAFLYINNTGSVVRKYYDLGDSINLLPTDQNMGIEPLVFQKDDPNCHLIGKIINAAISL